jgi:hypothetical protein
MENRLFKVSSAVSTAVTNLLNGAITSLAGPVGVTLTQPRLILRHLRVLNKSTSAVTCSFWVGATGASAAGTEFAFTGESIPANSHADWYGEYELDSTDFVTGSAGGATSIVANFEFEAGFA